MWLMMVFKRAVIRVVLNECGVDVADKEWLCKQMNGDRYNARSKAKECGWVGWLPVPSSVSSHVGGQGCVLIHTPTSEITKARLPGFRAPSEGVETVTSQPSSSGRV
jgi:hypothetical protein